MPLLDLPNRPQRLTKPFTPKDRDCRVRARPGDHLLPGALPLPEHRKWRFRSASGAQVFALPLPKRMTVNNAAT